MVKVADLGIGMVSRGVVGFIEDEQVHLREVNDAVHGIVAYDLRRGHHQGGRLPTFSAFFWRRLAGVGKNPLGFKPDSFSGHSDLLVNQPRGWGNKDDFC